MKNAGYEKYFFGKCDFCPFLGDFSHFAKTLRRGVEAKKSLKTPKRITAQRY